MLADHLTRAGFEVVLDFEPHTLARANYELQLADRAVVVWDNDADNGALFEFATRAFRSGKLLVLLPGLGEHTSLEGRATVIDLMLWDGEPEHSALDRLIGALHEPPRRPHTEPIGGGFEMFQSPRPGQEPETEQEQEPASIYVPTDGAPIEKRFLDSALLPEPLFKAVHSDPARSPVSKAEVATVPFLAKRRPLDRINVSVRAPRAVEPDNSFLVQVWLFKFGQYGTIRKLAAAADADAKDRGRRRLGLSATRGEQFTVVVDPDGLSIAQPRHVVTWNGDPVAAQFSMRAPSGAPRRDYCPTIRVLFGETPILHHALRVKVEARVPRWPQTQTAKGRFFRKAFLSYATPDRSKVLLQAQALRAARIDVFQDLLSLDPGERWEAQLYRRISEADLFLLFWSKSAAASNWVIREAEYALQCQRRRFKAGPEIIPVILDGPPPAPAPPSLQHLHFNDPVRCIIAAHE